jgi:hypothetical protein
MQCSQVLDPSSADHHNASLQQLQSKLRNINVLMLDKDNWRERGDELPANWHYIPYKVNIAYVPKSSKRVAAIAQPEPRDGPLAAYYETARVRATCPERAACFGQSLGLLQASWMRTAMPQQLAVRQFPCLALVCGSDSRALSLRSDCVIASIHSKQRSWDAGVTATQRTALGPRAAGAARAPSVHALRGIRYARLSGARQGPLPLESQASGVPLRASSIAKF